VWALPPGQIPYVKHLAVDKQGNVYVPDTTHNRMLKFDTNGKLLTMWGDTGGEQGQFIFFCSVECKPACPPPPPGWARCYDEPTGGIAVDDQGHVFVADYMGRIQKFDSNGKFITQWGSRGSGDGQFLCCAEGLAVDRQGNVYVVDVDNHRIQKFDNNGKFLTKWGSQGNGAEQFAGPFGIAVDNQGDVYVSDLDAYRVLKFDNQGKFLTQWGSQGTGEGQFSQNSAQGLAVDSQGHVFVADNPTRVEEFDSTGHFLSQWGSLDKGDLQIESPGGVAIDGQGNIYIAERTSGRIKKFRQK
jgi:DNA-binding beta-propeller fold protein YncE